ncbi:MAG: prolyl oligopeptidase family serine peptidase [Candidatus Bathyarchaeia archaeon]
MLQIRGTYNIEKYLVGDERIPLLIFYREQERAIPVIICLHGWNGHKEDMLMTCLKLADTGFCAAAIDARMHGERFQLDFWVKFFENFPKTFLTTVVETAKDVSRIIDFLESKPFIDSKRVGLMGGSMGGFTTSVAVMMEKRIKAAASIIGAANFPQLIKNLSSVEIPIFNSLKKEPMLNPDEETRRFCEKYDPLNNLSKFPPTALLLIGGTADTLVPKECIIPFYEALKPYYCGNPQDLKLVMYDVGHAFTSEMETEVTRWFKEKLYP